MLDRMKMQCAGQKEGRCWLGYGIYWSEREGLVRIWHILIRRKGAVG